LGFTGRFAGFAGGSAGSASVAGFCTSGPVGNLVDQIGNRIASK
jgi:hypothetical protein